MRAAALVLAAGEGVRLGSRVPKAFVSLAGKTLLERSLETLCSVSLLSHVVPVVPAAEAAGWSAPPVDAKQAGPVPGGARRQDSVAAGLASLPDEIEFVAVHDAARCLVSVADVEAVLRAAMESGAAILARPSPDTVKLVENGVIVSTPERRACWAAQTPQVFRVDLLREGLAKAEADAFTATDDAQLVERLGVPVRIVEGSASNLKITHPVDLAIAEKLIASEGNGASS
jgi:2-C-methyl-D-erythritol 4-phosphate cytidylyltransferase